MKKREIRLPTILGLLITIGGLVSGLWLLRGQLRQNALASAEEKPVNVRVSNIDNSSFTVSWTTEIAVPGFVELAAEGGSQVTSDERDQENGEIGSYFTHFVVVKNLQPAMEYEYKLGSGKNTYGIGDQSYKVRTASNLDNPPVADVAFGSVYTSSREPAIGAIVYADLPGIITQSALVKSSGSWVIPLSTARTNDMTNYATYDRATTEFKVTVVGGPMGNVKAMVMTANDSPVPELVLGQDYDFTTDSGSFKIITPDNGEMVNTNLPEIIGQAPVGTSVTIEIHSDEAIVNVVQTDENGRFSLSVPQGLTPGEHTVTVSAMVNGVLETISRSFTVYAAGESALPFYSASPSATIIPRVTVSPSPSVKPSPTLKPSPTVKVVATIVPSPTSRPTPTVVVTLPSPTPTTDLVQSGNESLTILWLAAGLGLMLTGGWWYSKAK